MLKQFFALLLLLVAVTAPAFGAGTGDLVVKLAGYNDYKVEPTGPLTEASLSEALRGAVEKKGLRIIDDKGALLCEIWLRAEVPTAAEEVAGALFSKIGEGTFVGVIHFAANGGDFRGQGIKPGWYTLRYGLILQDGNHLGVSPGRDFFLLCRAADDASPAKQLSFDEMIKMSRAASGTGHPSSWSLAAPTDEKNLPRIVRDEHEHAIIEMTIPTKSGPVAVALTIVGKTEG